jgi:hypothetical protein
MLLLYWKAIVLGLIGSILLLGNIELVANWLAEKGVVDWARYVRAEYLTGVGVTIIVALLILLASASPSALVCRCPACDHVLLNRGKYCGECRSEV